MDDFERKGSDPAAEVKAERGRYEPPRIAWREPYEPVAFGVSCAHQPGNPQCLQGGPVSA